MNTRTTYLALLSLVAGAVSLGPSVALAERDTGSNRDRQQQAEHQQRNQRQETNRQQTIGAAPQRVQQNSRPEYGRTTPQRAAQPSPQRAAQPSPQRAAQPSPQRAAQPSPQRAAQPSPQRAAQPSPQRFGQSTPPHAAQPAPQRIERTTPQRIQQNNRRQVEHGTPQRAERPVQPRVERNAPTRVERRVYEPRRSAVPERRHIETRRSFHVEPPRGAGHHVYRPVLRDRYYHGIHVYRHYGHAYPGFGFYYDDADALRWLAFTVVTLSIVNQLDELQQRTYEEALVHATTADIGDTIYWEDRFSSGWVTVTDIWYDASGRECREMEQSVTSVGRTESSFITVCRRPDGVWVVPAN